MAIGWLAAFKAIPWGEVIAAAPAVVQGATKLLEAVRKRGPAAAGTPGSAARGTDGADRVAVLEEEVKSLRSGMAELQAQQVAATALVESLAEQNQKLVSAVEILRLRTRVLSAAALIAVALLVWVALTR